MKVVDAIAVPLRSGIFRADRASVREGGAHDGFLYEGRPATPGFRTIREAGVSVSIMLLLEDGRVAHGDCADVRYAGVGGRGPLIDPGAPIAEIGQALQPELPGRDITSFRELGDQIDALEPGGRPLSTSLRYNISQALLVAAQSGGLTMAEVISDEYDTGRRADPGAALRPERRRALHQRRQDDHQEGRRLPARPDQHRRRQARLRRAAAPGLRAVGARPHRRDRGARVRSGDPHRRLRRARDDLHDDLDRIATYLDELRQRAAPYALRLEHPIDAGDREAQIETYVKLRALLACAASTSPWSTSGAMPSTTSGPSWLPGPPT
jgi:methylaspartate ammonia-lyase